MSRSRKNISMHAVTTACSEKLDKRLANRRFRKQVKEKLKKGQEDLSCLREVSNVWNFAKDGKIYRPEAEEEMRK